VINKILSKLNKHTHTIRAIAGTICLLVLLVGNPPAFAGEKSNDCAPKNADIGISSQWNFRVFLDDKQIGCHNYYLQEVDGQSQLSTVADFKYRLMLIPIYNYRHENNEVWQDGCLRQIESSTVVNGKLFSVEGQLEDQGFTVRTKDNEIAFVDCVMSFAYWNPEFLKADRLLNTQNGKYLDVRVGQAVMETIRNGTRTYESLRYQLETGKFAIDLWYSERGDWLALETKARGKTLRYERVFAIEGDLAAEVFP
jgi:hypothetical protein